MTWAADWGGNDLDYLKRKIVSKDYMTDIANATQERYAIPASLAPLTKYAQPTVPRGLDTAQWWAELSAPDIYYQQTGFANDYWEIAGGIDTESTNWLDETQIEDYIPTVYNPSTFDRPRFPRRTLRQWIDQLPESWQERAEYALTYGLVGFGSKRIISGELLKYAKSFLEFFKTPAGHRMGRVLSAKTLTQKTLWMSAHLTWAKNNDSDTLGTLTISRNSTAISTTYNVPVFTEQDFWDQLEMAYSSPYVASTTTRQDVLDSGQATILNMERYVDGILYGKEIYIYSSAMGGQPGENHFGLSKLRVFPDDWNGGRHPAVRECGLAHRYRMWGYVKEYTPEGDTQLITRPAEKGIVGQWNLAYETSSDNTDHDIKDGLAMTAEDVLTTMYDYWVNNGLPPIVESSTSYTYSHMDSYYIAGGVGVDIRDEAFMDDAYSGIYYPEKVTLVDNIAFEYV